MEAPLTLRSVADTETTGTDPPSIMLLNQFKAKNLRYAIIILSGRNITW